MVTHVLIISENEALYDWVCAYATLPLQGMSTQITAQTLCIARKQRPWASVCVYAMIAYAYIRMNFRAFVWKPQRVTSKTATNQNGHDQNGHKAIPKRPHSISKWIVVWSSNFCNYSTNLHQLNMSTSMYISIRSGDRPIRDQSRKLSKIAQTFGRYFFLPSLRGGPAKNCTHIISPASRQVVWKSAQRSFKVIQGYWHWHGRKWKLQLLDCKSYTPAIL